MTPATAVRPAVIDLGRLTPEQLAVLMPAVREAMKDKSYQQCPLGEDIATYLRAKRKRLTDSSFIDYEGSLDKLARYFPDLRIEDFEPPTGTDRIEEFLEQQWGTNAPRTYNKNLSIVSDFFLWYQRRGRLHGNPTLLIDRARKRDVYRTTFTADQRRAILAETPGRRDRLALTLLLDYAIRKGALKAVQIQHFDHARRRLTIFTKGQKVRNVPIPDPAFWNELEHLILETSAEPHHYLLQRQKGNGARMSIDPTLPMGGHGLHSWWYRALGRAGIVPEGIEAGEHMHKARHTAGQRLLDHTGNLKAVQQLLGHSSIATTGDVYVGWDEAALAASLQSALEAERGGDDG